MLSGREGGGGNFLDTVFKLLNTSVLDTKMVIICLKLIDTV